MFPVHVYDVSIVSMYHEIQLVVAARLARAFILTECVPTWSGHVLDVFVDSNMQIGNANLAR